MNQLLYEHMSSSYFSDWMLYCNEFLWIYRRKLWFCEEFVHARARTQMSCVTMKIKTCHSEDLHSLTNYHMYLEGTLTIEYNLLENDRKMTFL